MHEIALLDLAKVGKEQLRVVGGDTGISVPHTSHVFDNQADKEKLLLWAYLWLFRGYNGVPLGYRCVRLPPWS